MVEARAAPLIAEIRISTRPGVPFQRMPHTAARPSAPVVSASVRPPVAKAPDAPVDGSTKLIEAAGTGEPDSSVTSTVNPRVALDPGAYTAPSPSTTRIFNTSWAEAGSVANKIRR